MADILKPVYLRRRKRSRRAYWQLLGELRQGGHELEWLTARRLRELQSADTNQDDDNPDEHPLGNVLE